MEQLAITITMPVGLAQELEWRSVPTLPQLAPIVEAGAGAPRLFDLVKVRDPTLAVAFYFAMRDTVVAADLEQAARIAYAPDKRWAKVVTLKARTVLSAITGACSMPQDTIEGL